MSMFLFLKLLNVKYVNIDFFTFFKIVNTLYVAFNFFIYITDKFFTLFKYDIYRIHTVYFYYRGRGGKIEYSIRFSRNWIYFTYFAYFTYPPIFLGFYPREDRNCTLFLRHHFRHSCVG